MTKLVIRLGKDGQRYAQASPNVKLLGTVQDGQAVGALVRLADGSYAQMNGDFVRPLSAGRVEYAASGKLKQASRHTMAPGAPTASQSRLGPALKPVVLVKKRRLVPTNAV
jgi:hypothetical protein